MGGKSMKIHNEFSQRSDEWFTFKLGKFGASDGQAIASNGVGLATLCFEKVAERITGKRKDSYTNSDMERGNELELLARNSVELEYGAPISEVGLVEMNDYVIASPDGLVGDDGAIEIKCPRDDVFVKFMYDKKIDTKYFWQMQMQLLVSERKWVDYVLYNPNFPKPLIITRVERNEDDIKKLVEGIEKGTQKIEEILKSI